MEKVILLIMMIFFLSECRSQNSELLEMKLVLDRLDSKKEFVVKIKINNRSSQDFYIVRMNPVANMHFISHDNHDISEKVWDDYFYKLEVPEPPDSIVSAEKSQDSREVFFNCALQKELNEIELAGMDSISTNQKKDLIDLISIKYELVTLVKKKSSYVNEFTFHMNPDSLKSIVFSYNYSDMFHDIEEEFFYETEEGVVVIKNLPLERVCGYSLFQGAFNAKLNLD